MFLVPNEFSLIPLSLVSGWRHRSDLFNVDGSKNCITASSDTGRSLSRSVVDFRIAEVHRAREIRILSFRGFKELRDSTARLNFLKSTRPRRFRRSWAQSAESWSLPMSQSNSNPRLRRPMRIHRWKAKQRKTGTSDACELQLPAPDRSVSQGIRSVERCTTQDARGMGRGWKPAGSSWPENRLSKVIRSTSRRPTLPLT